MTQQFDETFDWVVVGNGAGSMTSSLQMAQAGKSVVILEKSRWAGGTTAKSGGVIWVPCNRFMQADGEGDTPEAAIAYLDAVTATDPDAPGTSPEKRRAYVDAAPRMIDFLVDQGIPLERAAAYWPDYYDELPGGCKTSRTVTAKLFDTRLLGPWATRLRPGFLPMPVRLEEGMELPYFKRSGRARAIMARVAARTIGAKLRGRNYVSAGAALQGWLLRAILNAGVDLRLESPASELIVEGGRVVGVTSVKDGKPVRIGARLGVLVNAGGFARNQEMRDRYMPGTRAEWSQTNESDTGDLHREMERIGAQLAQMDQMVGYQCTLVPGWEDKFPIPPAQSLTAKPHAILIDRTGQRYMNEGGSYELYCETMLRRDREVPALPGWAIFDSDYIEKYMLAGTMPGRKKPAEWAEAGYLKQAGSIAELAGLIDVDPAALKATVARWNDHCARGADADFHRGEREYDYWLGDTVAEPKQSLGAIARAPFYAVNVVPGDVSTYGGAVIDADARVLRPDGSAIDGLYACGVSTASVMGKVYPGAGASIGPSLTFGWIAARHAMRD
ncbi:FAD-dependent oxidoreductase [Stakelama tenebrarum]|uniref:FAD-dependent oxidoreductase n=1 Tax=Stakelama tenebrarum TaxID=2711215 RepID=A0A6G6Y7Y0_9SPHN|nr:FAD-dependent oxidoreductase [Sphingosinithalassobacter tenebrarum]QIG80818.1 FAD-dependent oxidoreductase [Sphingosinithalassobacter tenebrarum]